LPVKLVNLARKLGRSTARRRNNSPADPRISAADGGL
jgi:hypothetical protein